MTLTEVTFYARKLAPFIVIVTLIILILIFAIRLILMVVQNPTAQITPTPAPLQLDTRFHEIPPPAIGQYTHSGAFTYSLDTLDGTAEIETATAAAQIFFLPKNPPTFGFLTQIYQMAKTAGIDTETVKHVIRNTIAEFDDGKRKLSIDIDTFNFNYDYTITPEDGDFTGGILPAEKHIGDLASNFLDKMGKYPEDMAKGNRNIIYLKYDAASKQISLLDGPTGANMVEVDFFWPDVNAIPVASSSYYNSPDYVVLAFDKAGPHIIRAQTRIFERSTDQIGIYPIKSAQQAWDDLQKGKGYVISSVQKDGPVKIKKIFLAYYDPDSYQEYLQLVYVYLGENKFVAYVPAVTEALSKPIK